MAHTLLEQVWIVDNNKSHSAMGFLDEVLGYTLKENAVYHASCALSSTGALEFYGLYTTVNISGTLTAFRLNDKNANAHNPITGSKDSFWGKIFYHVSEKETVAYFKYMLDKQSAEGSESAFTYIIAEDINGDKVVFNDDKMYSNYGGTGIYNNPQTGRPELVDGGNQFLISKACRLDTGAEFKELYFVLSAKSYADTNCIVDFQGKTYRLVSVSNVKDVTGRYPAFAFPVSD